ncbi:MAG: hypothetical protein SFU25_04020 [Candidatus Caenarcaniphilales bacterium]|nr:hypothetical protein [Candidatus Caenarcaniphilales bacterium]
MADKQIKEILKFLESLISLYKNVIEEAILVYGVRQDNFFMLFPLSSSGIIYHYRKKNNALTLACCPSTSKRFWRVDR